MVNVKRIVLQILFLFIISYSIYASVHVGESFISFKDISLTLGFLKPLIIPIVLFYFIIKFLLPELIQLFETKISFDKEFLKNVLLILTLYLISSILLQYPITMLIKTFTKIETYQENLSIVYSNIVTPLFIFLIRRINSKKLFEGIIYGDLFLVLFIIMTKVSIWGINSIYKDFLWIITGILFPFLLFSLIEILLVPIGDKLKKKR